MNTWWCNCVIFYVTFLKKYLTGTEEEREVGEKKAIIKSCRGNNNKPEFSPGAESWTQGVEYVKRMIYL